jgi:hypothetical protein
MSSVANLIEQPFCLREPTRLACMIPVTETPSKSISLYFLATKVTFQYVLI